MSHTVIHYSVNTLPFFKLIPFTNIINPIYTSNELKNFDASFEDIGSQKAKPAEAEVNGWVGAPITLSDTRRAFKCGNIKKAAGPDAFSGQVLKLCTAQLVPMFTMIFNLSLAQSGTSQPE